MEKKSIIVIGRPEDKMKAISLEISKRMSIGFHINNELHQAVFKAKDSLNEFGKVGDIIKFKDGRK